MYNSDFLDNVVDISERIKNEEPDASLQKKLIDLVINDIMLYGRYEIPEDKWLYETAVYAVSRNPRFLGRVPKNLIDYDLCLTAIRVPKLSPGFAMQSIPKELYDRELCKECVLKNSKMIKNIPTEFINEDFIEELMQCGVDLSKEVTYINTCLKLKQQPNEEIINSESNITTNNNSYSNCDIPLDSLDVMFTKKCIEFLKSININTLKQLFEIYDNGMMVNLVGVKSPFYIPLMNKIKILKCKYLDVDPMIDEKSHHLDSDGLVELGLERRSINCLKRKGITSTDLFQFTREGTLKDKLSNLRNLGESSIVEIIETCNIITEYHDKVGYNVNINLSELDNIAILKSELVKLIDDRNRIDNEINNALSRIQELCNDDVKKGGSL